MFYQIILIFYIGDKVTPPRENNLSTGADDGIVVLYLRNRAFMRMGLETVECMFFSFKYATICISTDDSPEDLSRTIVVE